MYLSFQNCSREFFCKCNLLRFHGCWLYKISSPAFGLQKSSLLRSAAYSTLTVSLSGFSMNSQKFFSISEYLPSSARVLNVLFPGSENLHRVAYLSQWTLGRWGLHRLYRRAKAVRSRWRSPNWYTYLSLGQLLDGLASCRQPLGWSLIHRVGWREWAGRDDFYAPVLMSPFCVELFDIFDRFTKLFFRGSIFQNYYFCNRNCDTVLRKSGWLYKIFKIYITHDKVSNVLYPKICTFN